MSDRSDIEWTDATWNPIRGLGRNRWMCQKISPGCDNCYASTLNVRFGGQPYKSGDRVDHVLDRVLADHPFVRLDEKTLFNPVRWKQPRRVFVCSMTDLFGEWVPQAWLEQIWQVMLDAPQHQYQVLTKRPARMMRFVREVGGVAPHIWLGVSIELDRYAWRAGVLRGIPAGIRFISAEPLLGPLPSLDLTGIDWLITGGESGAHHRLLDLDWVRELRDRCQMQGVAFFHKQNGGRTHATGGRELDGRTWSEYPQ